MRVTPAQLNRLCTFSAVAIGAALLSLGPIADGDIYWHVAAGAEMLRRGELLRTDPFTLAAAGRVWVDVHWLFQLAVALIERGFGYVGLAIAKALAIAAGAAVATAAAERGGGEPGRDFCGAALLLLLFLARHLVPIRPIVVTLLLIAVFVLLLERARIDVGTVTARRALIALPLLQLIWVNCQGLAPLGPALVGCYVVGVAAAPPVGGSRRDAIPLALALAACLLASLASPYGLDAVRLPLRLLARITPGHDNVFSAAIAENIPPFVLARTAPEMTGHIVAVLIAVAAAFALLRPKLHPAHALVLFLFGVLALMANRNVVLFYWVLAPVMSIALAPRLSTLFWRPPARLALGAIMAGALAMGSVAFAREAPIGSPTPFHFPTESARMLVRLGAQGPVFAPDQHGGYLTATVPGLRPYIDTRLVLHTADEYEAYLALYDDPSRFDALDAREHFRYVVLTTAYPDRYLNLVAHLAGSPAWKVLYTDGAEVLFGRADGPGTVVDIAARSTVDAIAEDLSRRYARQPDVAMNAQINLARLLVVVGQPASALRVLDRLDSRAAAELRARAHFAAGQFAAAEALARVLLQTRPHDPRCWALLADLAWARHDFREARAHLGRALAADPYEPEARTLLERLDADRPRVAEPVAGGLRDHPLSRAQ